MKDTLLKKIYWLTSLNRFGEHFLKQLLQFTCWVSVIDEDRGSNKQSGL